MGDLLYQYENIESMDSGSRQQAAFYSTEQEIQEPISSGYVSVKTEAEQPMFKRERKNYRPVASIVDFAISNNFAAIALENNQINRLDFYNPSEIDSVDITKRTDDQIHKIFLDPSGRHMIVCMKSLESFYLGRNNKKPKVLQKFKTHQIDSIGWNKVNMNETTTGEILIGTSKGLIFETEIEAEEKFLIQMGAERYFKMVYSINVGEAVIGLHIERFPDSDRKFFIMATTRSRLYQFIGESTAEPPIFSTIFAVFDPNPAPYLELPGMLDHSDLKLFFSRSKDPPKYFGWLTSPGVYFGSFDFYRRSKDAITIDTSPTEVKEESPIAIAVTEFHCVLLYPNRFEAICTLNDEEVFAEHIPNRFGRAIGICTDHARRTLWVFTDAAIFQYIITKESRNVWQIYLEKKKFDFAKDYCKDNPAQLDIVLRKQAEQLFIDRHYQQSATCYALTQISFEEVALKFMQVKDPEALKMFLLKKMVGLKQQDRTQMTMIVTWLIELYLNQLGEMKDQGEKAKSELDKMQEDFRKLLVQTSVKNFLSQNRQLAYDLLSSHGDKENMIFFAMIVKDFDRVISHHIQQDDYKAALGVLKKQTDNDLYYKFSPVLMQHIPRETVDSWKQRNLDPRKLIPALVTHEQQTDDLHIREAVDYLEHCVYQLHVQDQAIHNYLISLYCKLEDERPLLRYLIGQGEDAEYVVYDLKYALRLCSEHCRHEACVHIYSTMGLFEEAVDLALTVDVEKAKIYADKPEDDDVLRKKLWLKVARHVVESQVDVGRAMELLNECGLLKIEDILPFFPDFVTIDQFKDAICKSLQEYNQHIDQLKNDMKDATASARVVRAEIHEIRNRYSTINAQEKCAVCHYPLLTRSFYCFPCSHVFHSDCLISEVSCHLKDRQRLKVEEIQSRLANISSTPMATMTTATGEITQANLYGKEQLKSELDELIASECIYCGDIMIRSLDKPFIEAHDFERMMSEWS
eukprot:gene16888-18594_t